MDLDALAQMIRPLPLAAASLALACAAARAADAAPPLACSADTPTVPLGGATLVRAWATSPEGRPPRFVWEATAGRLVASEAEARWDLSDLRPGTYAVVVRTSESADADSECVTRVIVRHDAASRGSGPPVPSRETGWSLLTPGQPETPGFGLYSYLLLGVPPTEASRERYLKAIEAYLRLVPEIRSLEQYVARRELNVAYLPVMTVPAPRASTELVLEQHDYARSRSLLRGLPGNRRDGPYIVSALAPLGGTGARAAPAGPHLVQDLSTVPPHLVSAWIKEFLNQAAQERFWEPRTAERLALKLRLTVGILGAGLPEVRKALDSWIAWTR
jgi:hypothetical protein